MKRLHEYSLPRDILRPGKYNFYFKRRGIFVKSPLDGFEVLDAIYNFGIRFYYERVIK